MSGTAKIISPIDGSVYAERPFLNGTAIASVVTSARDAQVDWAQLSIAERARYCRAALDALAAMQDEIVPEIAWQMGRPTRYGGENGGVQERGQYMIDIAEEALKPYVPAQKDGFRRYVKHVPLGVVMVIAPWNYPYLTAVNTDPSSR